MCKNDFVKYTENYVDLFDNWIEQINYPNTVLKVEKILSSYRILIITLVNNSDNPSEVWPVAAHSHLFEQDIPEQDFIEICFNLILECIIHETKELFLYKGQAVYSPHLILKKLT